MGYFERATMFGSRGGNAALARRAAQFEQMQEVAHYHGVLPADQQSPEAEGFKGAFFRVVDLISRPNYAIAGVFDTLAGTGKPGEYALERAFREMFSGVAGLEGDKEMFGDVLEQAGLPEGGKLSDLIGENSLTKNFNPGTRGAVGLALDIFTDPLTYISAPVKNASVVIGVGGEVRFLNKAGLAARKQKYMDKLAKARADFGLADDVGGDVVLRRIAESSDFVAKHGDASAALAKSEGMGLVEVASALNREIGEELVAKGGTELFEKAGWRFRPLPGVDLPVGIDRAIAKVSGALWDGMDKFALGKATKEFTGETLKALDQVFNQVPFLARKNQQYYRDRSEWFMRRTAAEHVAGIEARALMDGVHMKLWDDRDLWRTFIRALEQGADNPQMLDDWRRMAKAKGIEDPEHVMKKWKAKFDSSGQHEVQAGMLDPEDFARLEGRYWHRAVDHLDRKLRDDVQKQLSAQGTPRAGVKARGSREQRLIDLWDDFEGAMRKAGVEEKDILLNPYEVAKKRLTEHYEDMVTRTFLERVHKTMGFKQAREVKELNQALKVLSDGTEELTESQASFLEAFRERSSTHNPAGFKTARKQELQRLIFETPEGEAFQRIHEIVETLGKDLDAQTKRITEARIQASYRQMKNARSRAEIFDQNAFQKQAIAEQKVDQAVRKDLREARSFLEREANRVLKPEAGGHARALADQLKAAQERLKELRKRPSAGRAKKALEVAREERRAVQQEVKTLKRELASIRRRQAQLERRAKPRVRKGVAGPERPAETASYVGAKMSLRGSFFETVDKLDEAWTRADELDDVVQARLNRAGVAKEQADLLIADQVRNVEIIKDGIAEFRRLFKRMITNQEGESIGSLTRQLDEIEENLARLKARRDEITGAKKKAYAEIEKTDEVFEDLSATLDRLTDNKRYTASARKAARQEAKEAARRFREAHPTSLKDLQASDMAKFRALPANVRAAYLHETMGQIDEITHMEGFLRKFGDELEALDPKMKQLADTISTGKLYDQYGQEYAKISIRLSPRVRNADDVKVADTAVIQAQDEVRTADELFRQRQANYQKVHADRKAARSRGPEDKLAADPEEYARLKLEEDTARQLMDEAKRNKALAKEHLDDAMTRKKDIDPQGGSKILYIPQSIVDDLQNFENKFLQNPEVMKAITVYDKLSNWFKLAVTRYFPSFHVRNAYSNVAASFMDIGLEALNVNRARQAIDVLRGADGTFTVKGGEKIPYSMIRAELDALGIRVDKAMIAELTGTKQTAFDPLEKLFARGLREEGAIETAAGVATKAYAIPGNVENHARAMHYMALRRRGLTPQDAAMQVNKFLFDYADLSPTERAVFRRLFPFWTWTRKNATRQIKNLYERPGRVATQTKIFAGDRGPSGDLLPEYMRGQMNVKVQSDENGETWLTGIDLPISNMDILWAGGFGKTFREQIGLLTPLIKDPMEIGIGKDFFSGQPVHGVGQIREKLGYSMNRNLPGWAKDYFELQNVGTEEAPRWQANRLKLHIATKAMFLSRFISSKVQIDDMAREFGEGDANAGAVAMLKILSGLNLRGFDMESKERSMLYNRARELEDLLVDRGLMREFNKRYLPKETREEVEGANRRPSMF